jgi:hypothetical protein
MKKSKAYLILMETPLIGGFVEKQHERKKSTAWSGKTTEGLASPSDCHKTAPYRIRNLVLNVSSEPMPIFNLSVDEIILTST